MADDPKLPLRASYRFMQRLYASTLGGKCEEVPSEMDMLNEAFKRAGGSWMKVFQGAPEDISLLKKVMKAANKRGLLTKKPNWGK